MGNKISEEEQNYNADPGQVKSGAKPALSAGVRTKWVYTTSICRFYRLGAGIREKVYW